MKLENLVCRLKLEADKNADKKWTQDRLEVVQRKVRKQPTVTQSCRKQVANLRAKSEAIYEEIY
jgi:hypothetical protein